MILRMEDFTLYKVTTSGKKQALKEFIAGMLIYLFSTHWEYDVSVVLITWLVTLYRSPA